MATPGGLRVWEIRWRAALDAPGAGGAGAGGGGFGDADG
ncbi:hypothetical protein F750_5025 [Streptomyces sp. PAMC 26508]|nr:hypothetical protein F750_5025 [Streptomyces sp. PAMC 26508]